MPPREMTATSVVPPPMSPIMLPVGSCTGRPAPRGAAIGSSMMYAGLRAPANSAASCTARCSTPVMPDGTQITMRGCSDRRRGCTLVMKYLSIFSQISKSAMTPSFRGRMAWMWAGVRPIIRLASVPTASKRLSRALIATTDGSSSTMPRPRTYTTVLAVPKSTAMSRPMNWERTVSDIRVPSVRADSWRTLVGAQHDGPAPTRGHRVDGVTRLQQSPWSHVREPQRDLARGGLVTVARVHEVLGRRGGEITANRPRLRVVDLRRADELAYERERVV